MPGLRITRGSLMAKDNRPVVKKLLMYTCVMFALPVALFYLSDRVLFAGESLFIDVAALSLGSSI